MGKFVVTIKPEAERDIAKIKRSGDQASGKKIIQILDELMHHPYTGVGQPEALKYELSGYWSRRINQKDRLVYKVEEEIVTVTFVSAMGHYGDK